MDRLTDGITLPRRLGLTPTPKGQSKAALLALLSELRSAASAGDWNTVFQLGSRCLGDGYAAVRTLQIRTESTPARPGQRNPDNLITGMEALVASGRHTKSIERINNAAGSRSPSSVMQALADSLQKLADDDKRNLPVVRSLAQGPDMGISENPVRTSLEQAAIAALSRGLLALTQAEFQTKLAELQNASSDHPPPAIGEILAQTTASFARNLERWQQRLFFEVASGGALDAADSVDGMISFIERTLPRFAALQAAAFVEMNAARDAGKGSAAERLGRVAARAGGMKREALASHAAAYHLVLERERGALSDEMSDLVRRAPETAFVTEIPNGKNVDIAKLETVNDGDFVEFGGFVVDVAAGRDKAGKLIGTAKLLDPSSGAAVLVATAFTHLPHIGLTKGAYCHVNGYYRSKADLLSDQAGVEIDRLSMNDLADASWKIRWLRTGDSWYQRWYNSNNMEFSMGPQNIDNNDYGAGELVYPAFIRR